MGTSMFSVALMIAASGVSQSYAGAMWEQEIEDQNTVFKKYWDEELVWRFDDLPAKGSVPKFRMPYAGCIYPDRQGGTVNAMWKFDRAFHGGRSLAAGHERWDVSAHKETRRRRGPLGLFGAQESYTPHWYGHCNGWTAAAIRHAEPQKNVTRNGVTFTPADIKGLLAEVYMYSDTEFLGGLDHVINPAAFHVVVTNWIGRKSHPLGMETTPGKEVWNYPMYAYATSFAKRYGGRQVEVKMNVGYKNYTNQEFDEAPANNMVMYFHYDLDLDEEGKITGGRYYYDSARIDMLWLPKKPVQGGQEGNESGNPHLNVKEVLALWRESVDEELRKKWANIDPTEEDRVPLVAPDEQLADADADEPDADDSTSVESGPTAVDAEEAIEADAAR